MSAPARPRTTIVVAAHAEARALRASVASALGQTEQRIEVIVVGEPSATSSALEDLHDAQLVRVPCADLGVGARLNLGIALARGESIKLVCAPGSTLEASCVAREAAVLDAHPGCAVALALPAGCADPAAGALRPEALLAGLLQRQAPSLELALFRSEALRAVGGFDATLRSALAYDLWLRLLPERCVVALPEQLAHVPAREPLGDQPDAEDVASRAEHGCALVRALCDRGLDWWRDAVAAAAGLGDDAPAAWLELVVLLLRSRLPEGLPLARAAARRARELGVHVPAWDEIERRARAAPRAFASRPVAQPATAPTSSAERDVVAGERHAAHERDAADERDAAAARDAVHELAALFGRNAHTLRALQQSNRALARTTSWLATELDTTHREAEAGLALASGVLAKLRLRQRATQYSRGVLDRSRRAVDRWRARLGAAPSRREPERHAAAPAAGPRRRRWLILAAVPIDDIGGGQRSAQLARALVAAGDLVTYVARFPRQESVDLELRADLAGLEVLEWNAPRLRGWLDGRDEMLRVLVELPEAEVVALAREARQRGARVVYDKIDNWAACAWASWYAADTEHALIEVADDLVGSARLLVRQLAKNGRSAHLVPNAVDTGLFQPPDPDESVAAPPDLVRGDVTLLYAGSLWGDWFDWQLVCEVAARRPRWSVNLIGDRPARLPRALPANVHLLGLKPQTALPAYLAAADVCLIPFVPSPLVDAVSPLKVFEYLALERPVVAAPMPELHEMPYVFPALGAAETIAAVEQAVATPAPLAELERFRAHSSWQARVRVLDAIVARPTISVIVLCYDNRDVIEHCVESLLRARGQAGYQIVVVDNGSRDGSLEVLEGYAARGDIALHRNVVNGCASGRNLGVRASGSEIVAFLDSDQRALFPGWLDPALAILRDHAEVGAVGWSGGWFHQPGSGRGTVVDDLPDRGAAALTGAAFRSDVAYLATSGLVVPRAVLRRTEGFDERLDPTCFEDTDLSFQIKEAGYRLAYCPALGLDHRAHATTGALGGYGQVYRRNERYLLDKWRGRPEYFFDVPR